MRHIGPEDFVEALRSRRQPYQADYLAMYSSVLGGIVQDPALMLVPIDDHLVHRGDGVFEAMRCVDGAMYNLDAHIDRLMRSARGIELSLPVRRDELVDRLVETVRAGGERDAVVRLFVSRGPGGFGANPYQSPATQVYVVVTRAVVPFMQQHPEGASLGTSRISAKEPFFAGIKNCNYLPNVLMVKEAVDADVNFVVALDVHGHLAEGPTENIGLVTRDRVLLFPRLDGVLRGTTMLRLVTLADRLVALGELKAVAFRDVLPADAHDAAEILIVGTTRDVTSVRTYDGEHVGEDCPGPVARRLAALLDHDMRREPGMRTPVFV